MKAKTIKEVRYDVVSLTDFHVPFEDPIAIELAFRFCEWLQPKVIVLHEVHDFYAISRFDKDPDRKNDLQSEIDEANKYIKNLKKRCPRSRIILLKSNHTERLKKYLWGKAPELNSLRCLKLEELFKLKEIGVEYRECFYFRDVLFKHGSIIRQDSSYTCKAEFTKEGCSGCSGHTHRLGLYFTTKRGGKYVWVESGCLCKVNAEYIDGTANWQQGFAMFSFEDKGKQFIPQIVPIIDKSIMFGNRKFFIRRKKCKK
jgi:hypothetical protein